MKESYFKKEVQVEEELTEDWSGDAGAPVSSSTMDMYLSAIKKTSKE